jgi:hypothetical protein
VVRQVRDEIRYRVQALWPTSCPRAPDSVATEETCPSDGLWTELSSTFDEAQLLDLLVLSGWYRAVSHLGRTARLPLEPGTLTFASTRDPTR